MKTIALRNGKNFSSLEAFKEVLKNAHPNKPIDADDMRKRIRVLKFLAEAEETKADHIDLEDADHLVLKLIIKEAQWRVADEELMQIIDDVIEAKPTPKKEKTR